MKKRKKMIKLPSVDSLPREAWTPLYQYLTAAIAQARSARAASTYAARIDPTGCFSANAEYWRNAESALKWFRGQLVRQWKYHEWTAPAPPVAGHLQPDCGRIDPVRPEPA